ncbi:hypothetical protein N9N03_00870 [Chlamydiia bacterium]|nr:hypothetical protein [Chlamydiia bacterium]
MNVVIRRLNILEQNQQTPIFEDLAISGGGSAGTGVFYALKSMPKSVHDRIKRVTATSVGAITGGGYVTGLSLDILDKHSNVFLDEVVPKLYKNFLRGKSIENDRLLRNMLKNKIEIGIFHSLNDFLLKKKSKDHLQKKLEDSLSGKFGFLGVDQKMLISSIVEKWCHSEINKPIKSSVPDINTSNEDGLGKITFAELKLLSDVWPERFKEFRCFTTKAIKGSVFRVIKTILLQLLNAIFVQIIWGNVRFIISLLLSFFTEKDFFSGSLSIKPSGYLLCSSFSPNMSITDGIMASCSLPGIFNLKCHKINSTTEEYLRDGGLYNNSGLNILGDDKNNAKNNPEKTIWIIYSTVNFYYEDRNMPSVYKYDKSKLSKRRLINVINRYLMDTIDALLSIFLLPFFGYENMRIDDMNYCHQKAIKLGYEPVILTTEGQSGRNFKRTTNEINVVKRNAFFAMEYYLRKRGLILTSYPAAITVHLMKTILTAVVDLKKDFNFIQLSMPNERLFSEDLDPLITKLQSEIGYKFGMTSLTHFTLRLSEAIIHFKLKRSEVFDILLEKTKLKRIDLISLFGTGYNQIDMYISNQKSQNQWCNHKLKHDLVKLMSIYKQFSGINKNM